MNTFNDFKNAIGQKFRLQGFYTGEFAKQDTIIKVNDSTQEVEGEMFIAHFKDCRFIQALPSQFLKQNNRP